MSKPLFKFQNNQLLFDSVNLNDLQLIQNYQKPIILYRKNLIQQRIDWIKSWKKLHRLHFAMKANYHTEILKLILANNCGLDVVSLGEIEKGYEVGFKPSDLIFSGAGKTRAEISRAIDDDIYQINVESISELVRIEKIASLKNKKVNIGLRINPEVDAKTHPNIATALRDSKFGISMADVDVCLKILNSSQCLAFKSVSYHLGSQIMESAPFADALTKMKPLYTKLKAEFKTLERLDLGGGLGIDYRNHDMSVDAKQWENLKAVYDSELSDLGAEYLLEMGRFIVARSAILITEVQYIKKTENKEILILDVGMNNLMRPSLYQAHHHVFPLKKSNAEKKYMIVGPICESTDFFHKDFIMPELFEGDLIAISDVGAYGRSMASDYNLQPLALEHFI